MRPPVVALAALVAASTLCGCSSTSANPGRGEVRTGSLVAQWVDLPDGRVVVCVRAGANAVSCDWATATREGEQS